MARPTKENASYFSHDADMRNNRKVKALRARYGMEGYATWCMVLECLTDENGFVLAWDQLSIELVSGDFGISADRIIEIADYMARIKLVAIEDGSLYSPSHKARMQFVIDERERKRQWKQSKKEVCDGENRLNDGENAQIKGKEIKGKEIKGKGVGESPARAESSSNEPKQTPSEPSSQFAIVRQAIQQWQNADNGEALKQIALEQKYLGPIDPEITRFITHNLRKDPYRSLMIANPLEFFIEQFPGWICLPAAQRNNKTSQPQASGAYTNPVIRSSDADIHRPRSSALQLIQTNYPDIAEQFSDKHILSIQCRASDRSALEMVHAIAKTIHNGPPEKRTNAHQVLLPGLKIIGA